MQLFVIFTESSISAGSKASWAHDWPSFNFDAILVNSLEVRLVFF